MDALELAALNRAQNAIATAMGAGAMAEPMADEVARRKAFVELAANLALGIDLAEPSHPLIRRYLEFWRSKTAGHIAADATDPGGDLPGAFIASIAEASLLDALAQYATPLPPSGRSFLLASAAVGDEVAEGFPKPVRRQGLSVGQRDARKSVALIVITDELERIGQSRFMALLERELVASVTRASNQAVLAHFADSSTLDLPAGADPLADLRAGLAASQPSEGFVVAASPAYAADLATRTENSGGMGVRGGPFVPGVSVVTVDDLTGLVVIPASRVAMWLGELELARADQSTIVMADAPTGNSTTPTGHNYSGQAVVSLWQTNSVALRAERLYHLAGDATIVTVGAGS